MNKPDTAHPSPLHTPSSACPKCGKTHSLRDAQHLNRIEAKRASRAFIRHQYGISDEAGNYCNISGAGRSGDHE